MTAAAARESNVIPLPLPVPPFPTSKALALEASTRAQLDRVFLNGSTPDLDSLAGWEFRGINQPTWAGYLGIKKFVKGFHRTDEGGLMGYNCPVVQNVLDGRWHTKPSDAAPKRFGYYRVDRVDATARDNYYLHAVLLDYGKGNNGDPTAGLRDYLVSVDNDPDLYLGKAYYAIGPTRIFTNYFILERFRRGLSDYARR